MTKPTIIFYNQFGTYMGWKYLSNVTFFELRNWLQGDNYFFYKKQSFNGKSTNNDLFQLLRKQK